MTLARPVGLTAEAEGGQQVGQAASTTRVVAIRGEGDGRAKVKKVLPLKFLDTLVRQQRRSRGREQLQGKLRRMQREAAEAEAMRRKEEEEDTQRKYWEGAKGGFKRSESTLQRYC